MGGVLALGQGAGRAGKAARRWYLRGWVGWEHAEADGLGSC